jgi:hypothetical protein
MGTKKGQLLSLKPIFSSLSSAKSASYTMTTRMCS